MTTRKPQTWLPTAMLIDQLEAAWHGIPVCVHEVMRRKNPGPLFGLSLSMFLAGLAPWTFPGA